MKKTVRIDIDRQTNKALRGAKAATGQSASAMVFATDGGRARKARRSR